MGDTSTIADLLRAIKALADERRLSILGLLSQNPHTGEQLAALLGLSPSTISHHLARLRQAGLVSAEAEGYYSVYRLEADSLRAIANVLGSQAVLVELANSAYGEAHTRMQSASPEVRQSRGARSYRRRRKS